MCWLKLSDLKSYRVGLALLLLLLWGCAPVSETHAEPQVVTQLVASGICPQLRKTPSAPPSVRNRVNPLKATDENLQAGQRLFQTATPLACKLCHGQQGNGQGDPNFESTPSARNFTCASTMNALSDGQLFWVIRNGSPNTSMPAFSGLSEEDIWRLVHYLRGFAKSK